MSQAVTICISPSEAGWLVNIMDDYLRLREGKLPLMPHIVLEALIMPLRQELVEFHANCYTVEEG